MPEVSPEFYAQVSESIKLVFDLTSRIDERVKLLVEQHQEANSKIEKLMDRQENIFSRLSVLEAQEQRSGIGELRKEMQAVQVRMTSLEIYNQGHTNKWDKTVDFLFKIGIALVSAVALWKLGIKP
jgi:hypothetical protein